MPMAHTTIVVAIRGVLARLWMKGIFAVRMIWMINVCVKSDTTNQPIWKSAGFAHAPAILSKEVPAPFYNRRGWRVFEAQVEPRATVARALCGFRQFVRTDVISAQR